MRELWAAVNELIDEARAIKAEPPAQAAAGAILIFPRLLATLELVVRKTGHRDDVTALRLKLWEEMQNFNAVLFAIQASHKDWQIGIEESNQLGAAFRRIRAAAQALEAAVIERRSP